MWWDEVKVMIHSWVMNPWFVREGCVISSQNLKEFEINLKSHAQLLSSHLIWNSESVNLICSLFDNRGWLFAPSLASPCYARAWQSYIGSLSPLQNLIWSEPHLDSSLRLTVSPYSYLSLLDLGLVASASHHLSANLLLSSLYLLSGFYSSHFSVSLILSVSSMASLICSLFIYFFCLNFVFVINYCHLFY